MSGIQGGFTSLGHLYQEFTALGVYLVKRLQETPEDICHFLAAQHLWNIPSLLCN